MKMMDSVAFGDTLALLNVARAAFGQDMLSELPDSRPGKAADCLFYRALSSIGVSHVSGSGTMRCKDERQASYLASLWNTSSHGPEVESPSQFADVIGMFDRGHTPQYATTLNRDF